METNTLILIFFAILLFTGIFGKYRHTTTSARAPLSKQSGYHRNEEELFPLTDRNSCPNNISVFYSLCRRLHRIWRICDAFGGTARQEEVQEAVKEGQGQGRLHLRMILNIRY
jgi:hypothetical protein